MNRIGPPFVGRVSADGFIIEVGIIGEAEARRRVLTLWSAGSALREVDQARWLLTMPTPAEVRCEIAPGLPVEIVSGGLAPAGWQQTTGRGSLRTFEGGRWTERIVSDLQLLDPSEWIDLGALTICDLSPVERTAPTPAHIESPGIPEVVSLRREAKVGRRSSRVDQIARDLARPERQAKQRAGGGRARPGRGMLSRLLLRSPAASVIRHKHAKYLRSLTDAFERKQFDDALRDAIAIGGAVGFMALRLPPRRGAISGPAIKRREGGGGIPWGPTIHQHLSAMYRRAAAELESDGRIEQAAFVLADLLNNVLGAVAVLERHQRYTLAAELAEGRNMAADLVVRLHWRAGNHDRAVEVARARGAYAAAIKRLADVDPDQARNLRAAWIDDLIQAGDHVAAVEAAWPDLKLRVLVAPVIQAAMALGGQTAAHMLAYLLAYRANGKSRAAAMVLLRSQDPELAQPRDRFLAALSSLRCSDPSIDRELATAALRAMVRHDAAPAWDEQTARRAMNALSHRADPILRADLPPFGGRQLEKQKQGGVVRVDAPEHAGQLPVFDVAALAGRALLVAHGYHGARLLTLDGRTRARWDIPTHRLVVADHGGTALLASDIGDSSWELHTLNLASRQVSPWLTIRTDHLEPSYDGLTLIVVDEQGAINFLDALANSAKVIWRELHDVGAAVALSRSPGQLSAVVRTAPGAGLPEGRFELWQWDMPEIILRSRSPVSWRHAQTGITSSGVFLSLVPGDEGSGSGQSFILTAQMDRSTQRNQCIEAFGPVQMLTSGPAHALVHTSEDHTRVDLSTRSPGPTDISIRFPGLTSPQIRIHGETVAAWDRSGRIVAVDTARQRVISTLRTFL